MIKRDRDRERETERKREIKGMVGILWEDT